LLDMLGVGIDREGTDQGPRAQRQEDHLRVEGLQSRCGIEKFLAVLPERPHEHLEPEAATHGCDPQAGKQMVDRGRRQNRHAKARQPLVDRFGRDAGERPVELDRLHVPRRAVGKRSQGVQAGRIVGGREHRLEAPAKVPRSEALIHSGSVLALRVGSRPTAHATL
jgi:hypothetical protein